MFDRDWILSVARQRLALRPDVLAKLEMELMLGVGNLPAAILAGAMDDQERDRFIAAAMGAGAIKQRSSASLVAAIDGWAERLPPTSPPKIEPLTSQGAAKPVANPLRLREKPEARQQRRLQRFREMGGELRQAGKGWHCYPLHSGYLAALAAEEQRAGRPRHTRQDVKSDLIKAMNRKS